MILGIHHAQITIPPGAEDKARAFYCDLLGLTEIPKPDSLGGRGGFWLRVGAQDVHVGTEDGVERMATKAHLAYQVTDIAPWRERLETRGCPVLTGIPILGCERFETRDPFGNRIEFIQILELNQP
jgi:catechol 2,3-dioxygenase-like lactoylglutathione lyase family enzyme